MISMPSTMVMTVALDVDSSSSSRAWTKNTQKTLTSRPEAMMSGISWAAVEASFTPVTLFHCNVNSVAATMKPAAPARKRARRK